MMNFRRYLLSGIVFQLPEGGGGPASSGGGSASPASAAPSGDAAPASSAEAPSTPDGGAESVDFSLIFGDGPEPSVAPSPPPAAAPTTPPAPVQPASQPQPATPAAAQPSVPAAPAAPAAPAPTEAPSAPAAPAAPQLDPYDPGALAQTLLQSEVQAIQHVAETVFKLSDGEIEELESNTVAAVPKLLAKAVVRAQQNTLQTLGRLLPTMMQRQTEIMKRHMEHEQAFYARWPQLDRVKHHDVLTKYAVLYRQANPQATTQDMIEQVGPMVMIAAGVNPSVQPPAPAAQVPTSPMAAAPGARPQPTPFTPAAPLAGAPFISPQVEQTAIEAMFDPNNG